VNLLSAMHGLKNSFSLWLFSYVWCCLTAIVFLWTSALLCCSYPASVIGTPQTDDDDSGGFSSNRSHPILVTCPDHLTVSLCCRVNQLKNEFDSKSETDIVIISVNKTLTFFFRENGISSRGSRGSHRLD